MAEIRKYPAVRHLRGDQAAHTLYFRNGKLARSGRGLALWFRPLAAAVAEVPLDDREVPFLFRGRTSDFQQAVVQGVIAYRITDPQQLAERVDFTIDLDTGAWRRTPLEQLAGLLTQLAQELAHEYLAQTELVVSLRVEVTAVRVATVQPTADMDKALQTPTREAIQQQADEATFARRAQAVEKERAIAENELNNKTELARQEERLIAQEGENAQRRASDEAQALRIATEAAANPGKVEHLYLTPDLLGPLAARFLNGHSGSAASQDR